MICKKIKLLKKRTVKGRFDQINKTSQSKILKLKSSSHNVQKIIHNLKNKIDSLTSKTDEHNILLLRSKNLLDEYQIHVQKIIQNTNKSQVLFDGKKGGLGDDLFDEHRNDNKENLKKELITLLRVRELTSKYLDKAIKLHESDLEEYKKDSKMNTSKINLSNNLIQYFIDRFKVTERQFLGILHKAKAMVTLLCHYFRVFKGNNPIVFEDVGNPLSGHDDISGKNKRFYNEILEILSQPSTRDIPCMTLQQIEAIENNYCVLSHIQKKRRPNLIPLISQATKFPICFKKF
ncbi:unnamed protein product [Moneuplotes crassus]|uniref:Uncharacterized protein n=1 Tax=Euplotes crassus TaxID=5936 RepID=A0AAD1XGA9_EUPCR|nr:unnamed protein product [Moneuplotes crassus]